MQQPHMNLDREVKLQCLVSLESCQERFYLRFNTALLCLCSIWKNKIQVLYLFKKHILP